MSILKRMPIRIIFCLFYGLVISFGKFVWFLVRLLVVLNETGQNILYLLHHCRVLLYLLSKEKYLKLYCWIFNFLYFIIILIIQMINCSQERSNWHLWKVKNRRTYKYNLCVNHYCWVLVSEWLSEGQTGVCYFKVLC